MKSVKINPMMMDPEKYDEEMVKESAETLLEAEEIRKDPKLMKAINKHWESQKGKINSIKKLKEHAQAFTEDKMDKMKAGESVEE